MLPWQVHLYVLLTTGSLSVLCMIIGSLTFLLFKEKRSSTGAHLNFWCGVSALGVDVSYLVGIGVSDLRYLNPSSSNVTIGCKIQAFALEFSGFSFGLLFLAIAFNTYYVVTWQTARPLAPVWTQLLIVYTLSLGNAMLPVIYNKYYFDGIFCWTDALHWGWIFGIFYIPMAVLVCISGVFWALAIYKLRAIEVKAHEYTILNNTPNERRVGGFVAVYTRTGLFVFLCMSAFVMSALWQVWEKIHGIKSAQDSIVGYIASTTFYVMMGSLGTIVFISTCVSRRNFDLWANFVLGWPLPLTALHAGALGSSSTHGSSHNDGLSRGYGSASASRSHTPSVTPWPVSQKNGGQR